VGGVVGGEKREIRWVKATLSLAQEGSHSWREHLSTNDIAALDLDPTHYHFSPPSGDDAIGTASASRRSVRGGEGTDPKP
jgi:hypothetical protein